MWMPLFVAAATAAAPSVPEPPVDAVVLVQQGSTLCAGALVSPAGAIVTAYHCVAAGGRPRIMLRDGRSAVGRVVSVRPSVDLAVIIAPELAGEAWIPVADAAPVPGTPVQALGHPYGVRLPTGFMEGTLRWSVSTGAVSAVGPSALQFDAPVNPGNSGGPVVDGDGRLVGVVSRKSSGGEGLGFAGRSEHVAALLARPRGGMGLFGGTVAAHVAGSLYSDSGTFAVGPLVELAMRDRVVVTGTWGLGLGSRWDAVQFDEVRWLGPEARIGLRQRLFRGPWTIRLDAFGGAAGLTTLVGTVTDEVDLVRTVEPVLLAGGLVQLGNAGFELSFTEDGASRATLVLRWPGVITVF